jgi:Transglycosylase-like domain
MAGLRRLRQGDLMKKRAVILLALACGLASAATPALADEPAGGNETAGGAGTRAAGERLQNAYAHWRRKLRRYGVWHGRNLATAARSEQRKPTARELSHSIHRMQRRFHRFLRTAQGREVHFGLKVRRIPAWGRSHLRSIATCESRNNPRAIGGGGAFRGMYQFTFGTWRVVGGYGDPAVAPRSEQTWRAWRLLSRHGSGHWPVCG